MWGSVAGGAGAVIGALVGAILPAQRKELIYSAK
jgi:ABC-type xylose transport system permease subunit